MLDTKFFLILIFASFYEFLNHNLGHFTAKIEIVLLSIPLYDFKKIFDTS